MEMRVMIFGLYFSDGQSDRYILKHRLMRRAYTDIPIQTKTTPTNSLNIYPWRRFLMETNIDSFRSRCNSRKCLLI